MSIVDIAPAAPLAAKRVRHSWGEPVRDFRKTERECSRCGLVKVTHHEAVVWTDYCRGGPDDREEWPAGPVPPCSPREGVR